VQQRGPSGMYAGSPIAAWGAQFCGRDNVLFAASPPNPLRTPHPVTAGVHLVGAAVSQGQEGAPPGPQWLLRRRVRFAQPDGAWRWCARGGCAWKSARVPVVYARWYARVPLSRARLGPLSQPRPHHPPHAPAQNLFKKFSNNQEPPKAFFDALGQNRDYNVDLIPKFIMANGAPGSAGARPRAAAADRHRACVRPCGLP